MLALLIGFLFGVRRWCGSEVTLLCPRIDVFFTDLCSFRTIDSQSTLGGSDAYHSTLLCKDTEVGG